MPEGLIDGYSDDQVRDLFAYLLSAARDCRAIPEPHFPACLLSVKEWV